MKVIKEDLPTEGVVIAGVRFMPGKTSDVDAALGRELIKRKGFSEAGKKGGVNNVTKSDRNKV